jgi:excisionase family DNA binding protein
MSECLTYTVGEAARVIDVGGSVAYELVRRGDLRTVHVGRRVLISPRRRAQLLGERLTS